MHLDYPFVVFSHLRWNFVYQRPQHLLSRLATRHRVLFVEEPDPDPSGELRWERSEPERNVTVYRPRTRSLAPGFHPEQLAEIAALMPELRAEAGSGDPVAWLYTPLALPLIDTLRPSAVVYDCMDELSLFAGAPPELHERESALLARADVVFTGGPSLFRSKQGRHGNLHCFSSSVDAEHFGRARPRRPPGVRAVEPVDQVDLPRPRLGYYGVLDERLDFSLLDAMAEAHPEWQIVLVGPVAKIDAATLPRRSNLHYFGQRSYGELPAYLAGWDVCLLPFALNDSTRFISPTKTLEYMAAERPIVSTPITDVAEPYADIVRIAGEPRAFIAACEAALDEPAEGRAIRAARMREVIARTSWDGTAAAMEQLVTDALARRRPHSHERTRDPHAAPAS
jgi:glycosyltransferase involved in cell wall biosynthesis